MSGERWHELAETLLGTVASLLDQREALLRYLSKTGADLEVARARIEELERLNGVLAIELYRLKAKRPSKARVGAVAALIGLIVPNLVTGGSEGLAAEIYRDVRGIEEKAAAVAVACHVELRTPQERMQGAGVADPATAGDIPDPDGGRRETRVVSDATGARDSVATEIVRGHQAIETDSASPGTELRSYVTSFEETEWQRGNDEATYMLTIPSETHGAGLAPSVTVQRRQASGTFEDVGVSVSTLPDGTVRVGSVMAFAGRAIVR